MYLYISIVHTKIINNICMCICVCICICMCICICFILPRCVLGAGSSFASACSMLGAHQLEYARHTFSDTFYLYGQFSKFHVCFAA